MKDDDVLNAMRHFRKRAESYWSDIYQSFADDVAFVTNKANQWEESDRKARKAQKRPCLSINKLALFVKQQVNSLRANKLTLNAIPVDDSDTTKAKLYDDVLEFVLKNSHSDVATDWAYEMAVKGGFGFVQVTTEYENDLSFNQNIVIKRIENPLSTYISPESRSPTGSDMTEAITGQWITKADFERHYPNVHASSADTFDDVVDGWVDSEQIFIAEYYRIEYKADILYLLSTGDTVLKSTYTPMPMVDVIDERPTQTKTVMWYKCTYDNVLESTQLPFDFIPIILIVGDEQWVKNKRYWHSMIVNAKDPQQLYNLVRTGQAEQLKKAMNRPWVADGRSISGYEKYWEHASSNPNLQFLPYHSTSDSGQPLTPPFLADVYQGSPDLMREAMTTSDEIKATTGIFDASLGSQGNETSGRAILARQRQGDQANFHFLDNFKRSYEHMGRVILSAVPKVYDTPRILRIALDDGEQERFKTVLVNVGENSQLAIKYQKELSTIQAIDGVYNDLTVGRYDVRIKTGVDYSTQREENRELLMELGRNNPNLMQIAGDLIVKSFDFKDADKLAERLKKALPPQFVEDTHMPEQMQAQLGQMEQAIQTLQSQLEHAKKALDDKDKDYQKDITIATIQARTQMIIAKMKIDPSFNPFAQDTLHHAGFFVPNEMVDGEDWDNVTMQENVNV